MEFRRKSLIILEIEHYRYDTRLIGKINDISQLKRQLKKIETLYDKGNDNFNELFCRMFCWSVTDTKEPPDYVYDRDTKQLYQPEF